MASGEVATSRVSAVNGTDESDRSQRFTRMCWVLIRHVGTAPGVDCSRVGDTCGVCQEPTFSSSETVSIATPAPTVYYTLAHARAHTGPCSRDCRPSAHAPERLRRWSSVECGELSFNSGDARSRPVLRSGVGSPLRPHVVSAVRSARQHAGAGATAHSHGMSRGAGQVRPAAQPLLRVPSLVLCAAPLSSSVSMIPLRKKNKMLWVRGSLLTKYRIATFAPQRTFSFTPLGLAFCFFRFSNTHTPG